MSLSLIKYKMIGNKMNNFFDTVDSKKWRLVSPNLYCWWSYDNSLKSWCATLHDSHGNLVSDTVH